MVIARPLSRDLSLRAADIPNVANLAVGTFNPEARLNACRPRGPRFVEELEQPGPFGRSERHASAMDVSRLPELVDKTPPSGPAHVEASFSIKHPDGEVRHVRMSAARKDKSLDSGLAMTMSDVTEEVQAQRELAHQAFYDPLTGLPNRALLPRPAGKGTGPVPAQRLERCSSRARPRPLQGGQRQSRPRGRRCRARGQ